MGKNIKKKKRKKMNQKGFTLIELLAVIAVLSLVLSVSIYSVTSLISNAKAKTYLTTRNEIEKAAGNYSFENSNEIFFAPIGDNAEYQCITVKELVDSGFLDSNITKSNVTDNLKVSLNSFVYLERNTENKAIIKKNYVDEDNSICGNVVNVTGAVRISSEPSDWSKSKNITVTYKLKSMGGIANKSNYQFYYNYTSNDGMLNISNDDIKNTSEFFMIDRIGTVYANIWNIETDSPVADNRYVVDKFDFDGPTIALGNPNTTDEFVDSEANVNLKIYDCDIEGTNCSGLDDITNDELLKTKIVNVGKLKVYVGNKEVKNIKLTYVDHGKYKLNIKTNENGAVKIKFLEGAFSDKVVDDKNYNKTTELYPKIIFDNTPLQIDVSNTSTPFAPEQTATLTCRDNNSGITYYIGPTKPTSSTIFSSITNVENSTLKKYEIIVPKKINKVGKYYFSCKDGNGDITTMEINYWNYTIKSFLNLVDGTEGEYNTKNYQLGKTSSYLGMDGMTVLFSEALSSNDIAKTFIKDGTSINHYMGYSSGDPSANSNASPIFNEVILKSGGIYVLWFDRNKVKLSFNTNGGDLISSDTRFTKLSNDDIAKNGNTVIQTIKYEGSMNEDGLINYNNSEYINISKFGFIASSNQWKCKNGCSTSGKTYTQSGKTPPYSADDFCNAKLDDCNVTLMVNWTEIKYNVKFNLKGGKGSFSDMSNVSYSTTKSVETPWKKIRFVSKTNSAFDSGCANPTIGTSEYELDYNWYVNEENMYKIKSFSGKTFKNLESGATVNFVADWSLKNGDVLKYPTISKTGCKCGWDIEDGSKTVKYASGANYNENLNLNGNTNDGYLSINIYPVCQKENPKDIYDYRCYYNSNDTTDKKNNTYYYITTCGPTNSDYCNYTEANGISRLGQVLRGNLKGKDSEHCKYTITYDCKTNGGTENNSTIANKYTVAPNLSKTCTKSGWNFVGWNTDKNAHVGLKSENVKRKNQTLYAIYKKTLKTMFYPTGFGISMPEGINVNDYSDVSFGCNPDFSACSSTCTLYNKATSCRAISPNIVSSRKSFFASSSDDYSSYNANSTNHVKENTVFNAAIPQNNEDIRYYFVPRDNISAIRYKCDTYHDGDGKYRNRMDIFNISNCDGINCKYTALNGINNNSTTERNRLSTTMADGCKAEYYSSSSLVCYNGASTSSGQKSSVSACQKLSLYRTTSKISANGSNSWYYVPDKKCYISGATLSSSYPSACNTSSSSSPTYNGSGNYYVYINTGGATYNGRSGWFQFNYSSVFYVKNIESYFSYPGCYISNIGGYTSYLDASDSGKYLYASWDCGGAKCYSCTNSNGSQQWYSRSPGGGCTYWVQVSSANCR